MSDWKEIKLGEVVEISNGYGFKGTDFIEKGIPVIKIKNVKPRRLVLDDLSYVSEEVATGKDKFIIKKNDILITMSGNRSDGSPDSWVGKVCQFNSDDKYLLNQRVSIINVDKTQANPKYITHLLSSWEYQTLLISLSNSSGGQANISPDIVKSLDILLPSIEEQNYISDVLQCIDDKLDLIQYQSKILDKLADSVLKNWLTRK
jgi:type I restriction enzyme S subunit